MEYLKNLFNLGKNKNSLDDKQKTYIKAYEWMFRNLPSCKKIDILSAKGEYKFPDYVIDWIIDTWIKENNDNGGTYCNESWNYELFSKANRYINYEWSPSFENHKKKEIKTLENAEVLNKYKFMTIDQEKENDLSMTDIMIKYHINQEQ